MPAVDATDLLDRLTRVTEGERDGMDRTMTVLLWLTVLAKLPIGGLVWMWWLTRPTDTDRDGGGGAKIDAEGDPLPRPRWPSRPRRGNHAGGPPPLAPPRNGRAITRARSTALPGVAADRGRLLDHRLGRENSQ
jgi:hypothetical protein